MPLNLQQLTKRGQPSYYYSLTGRCATVPPPWGSYRVSLTGRSTVQTLKSAGQLGEIYFAVIVVVVVVGIGMAMAMVVIVVIVCPGCRWGYRYSPIPYM